MSNADKVERRSNDESAPVLVRKAKRWLIIIAVVALALAIFGIVTRKIEQGRLAEWTQKQAVPSVATTLPLKGSGQQELILPAVIQGLFNAEIRARVNGYIKEWRYDIGARLKSGEILAVIDAPDLDQQFEQAKGELSRAVAHMNLAKLTSKRWEALRSSTAVSQQSADEKSGDTEAKVADLSAAKSNLERLNALEGFKQIIAPFDCVVTARKIDIGVLVGPGNQLELFDVSDIHQVYIYVRVPQAYASQLVEGMKTTLTLPQYKNRVFNARLLSTSSAIAESSRTLLVQLIADNPDYALLPGAYTEVHFSLSGNPGVMRVPSNTLFYRNNAVNVAIVGPDQKVTVKKVEIVRDLGEVVEVTGVSPSDRLIQYPSETIGNGDVVKIAEKEHAESGSSAKKAEAK